MYRRQLSPLKDNSFFLFGSCGTGKSSLLREILENRTDCIKFDLLETDTEKKLARKPESLKKLITARETPPCWVIIDEIQKAPALLDVVHSLIESTKIKFALTGSSARKLKRGAANLLAGRAFVFHLYPLTHSELGDDFQLNQALLWGTLPKIYDLDTDEQKELFLTSYADTYIREEIISEQLVRNITPFRHFIEIAAQSNGEIINYSKIARDIRVEDTTVKNYFEILEDTHIAFRLPGYSESVRKQQTKAPKFYLFDTGVKRAMEEFQISKLPEGSSQYGKAFEHFIILECVRLNDYYRRKYKFSYLLQLLLLLHSYHLENSPYILPKAAL